MEAHRLRQRTEYDMEMLREVGFCSGIENYSRILDGRAPGEPPATLLDFFPDDFLTFIDESHNTVPQIRGMYEGDRSRKMALVITSYSIHYTKLYEMASMSECRYRAEMPASVR